MKARAKVRKFDFEVAFGESLLKRAPRDPRTVEMMAHLYTQVGRIDDGLTLDERLVTLEPDNAGAYYNLACSLAIKGQIDAAFDRLGTACEKGYADFTWLLKDEDLAPLHNDPRWAHFETLAEE